MTLDNEVVKTLRAARVPCTSVARQPSAQIVGEAPDTLLKESFGDPSVTRLEDRLVDSRQIADRIDASALNEVQRQTRALQYFEADGEASKAPQTRNDAGERPAAAAAR